MRLDSLAFGGDAVGREEEGRVVFVSGGAPGDLVEVRFTERKKSWARGELERVVEPGRRVTPPCPLAGTCGGCPWMHVEVAAQLEAKQAIVARALERTGAEVLPIAAAPDWLGYRRRAKLTARAGTVGFLARRSHRVVAVERCPALDPRLDAAMQVAQKALGPQLGEGGTLSGLCADDGRVHLAVECGEGGAPETAADAAEPLVGTHGIVGISVRGGTAERPTARYWGEARLALGPGFCSSAAGFQQANSSQNELMRRLVLAWALPEPAASPPSGGAELPRLLELYAGDGNFTRDLVRRARVLAVEGEPEAAARLVDNLRASFPRTAGSSQRWQVRGEAAGRAVLRLAQGRESFDVVVLDPPRAGAAEVLEGLAALGPARIVYVSCDPMTLARDLGRLGTMGYRTVRAQPIDQMPHTAHIEVIALLERA